METRKGKVTVAQFDRRWSGQYGEMFIHRITFEDGTSGEYMAKVEAQDKFIVGQEAEYTYDDSNGQYAPKIKPAAPAFAPGGGGGFGKADPKKQASIERQQALKFALETYDVNSIGLDKVLEFAEKLYDFIRDEYAKQPADIDKTVTTNPDKLPF